MKPIRLIAILLSLALLLSACSFPGSQETVTFYYPRDPQQKSNTPSDTFYTAERREITGQTTNVRYLLSLYLQGPLDDQSFSPFPEGTRLVMLDIHNGQYFVQLSQEFSQLSGIDLTVACACISLTCFNMADVDRVTVITPASGDHPAVEMTLTREDLTLMDTVAETPTP